jgi:hypothetical protein
MGRPKPFVQNTPVLDLKKIGSIPKDAKNVFSCKNGDFVSKVRKKKGRVFHILHNRACGKPRYFLPKAAFLLGLSAWFSTFSTFFVVENSKFINFFQTLLTFGKNADFAPREVGISPAFCRGQKHIYEKKLRRKYEQKRERRKKWEKL